MPVQQFGELVCYKDSLIGQIAPGRWGIPPAGQQGQVVKADSTYAGGLGSILSAGRKNR